jgi:SAM-dependent methyltransferase
MTEQLRYLQNYPALVEHLLKHHPEDQAMAMAVGGQYERFGVLEHALLRQCGMTPDSIVVDVGCGSGRLAFQLRRYPKLRYLGTDVVPALLAYAKKRVARPDFAFRHVTSLHVPAKPATADFAVFFSVFTHLLHEESYVYLQEAHRVLKPGGKVIFSFLEFAVEHNWPVFRANTDWVRERTMAGHLNVFQHRGDIRVWARQLGFAVDTFWPGDARLINVEADAASDEVPAGAYALGQSVCVLRKPLAGEPVVAAPAAAIDSDLAQRRQSLAAKRSARQAERRARNGTRPAGPGPAAPAAADPPAPAGPEPAMTAPRRRRRRPPE